jgi:hypothetical protein
VLSGDHLHPLGGDVDGDGLDDVFTFEDPAIANAAQVFYSEASRMRAGAIVPDLTSIAVIPDQDGDGDDELWGGLPGATARGRAALLFGGATPSLALLANGSVAGQVAGVGVAAGDFDGDGFVDLAVTEHRSVAIYYGP